MHDIITIGSATLDYFIEVNKKQLSLIHKARKDKVCLPIGSKILINHLEQDTGGGGTNTAFAFSRMGLKTGWIGKIGNDRNSQHILDELKKEKIRFLGKQTKGGTGFSVIIIGIEKNRTILAYKGTNDLLKWKDIKSKKAKWLYFGSMMGKSLETEKKMAKWAKKNKINYSFNPSTYLARKGLKKLKTIVDGCTILLLNKEEAQLLSKKQKINQMLKTLQKYAKIVVITDGAKGAYAYDKNTKYTLHPRKTKTKETTGAGDAFAAGFTAGYIKNKKIEHALHLGYAQASSIIQYIGAKNKLLSIAQANKIIKNTPSKITKTKI